MQSSWPSAVKEHQNPEIESQFARFVSVLGGLNKIRSLNNIPPKERISFTVGCTEEAAAQLEPMLPYLKSLAKADCAGMGSDLSLPEMPAEINVDSMQVTVDLGQFIDVEAEIKRNEKLLENVNKQIGGKKGKLSNENFVARAPAEVVEKEKAALADLEQQLDAVTATLEKLRASK